MRIEPEEVLKEQRIAPQRRIENTDAERALVRTAMRIGRIDDAGTVALFPAPATGQITPGPDGALWFVAGATVGRIATSSQ